MSSFLVDLELRRCWSSVFQQGCSHGRNDAAVRSGQETSYLAGAATGSHLPSLGMRGLSGSGDMSSRSSTETGSNSSGAEPAEGRRRPAGDPPFPDLSTVRALLLHAHAAAGRVALLHDQLLLLLHSFTSVTSVGCTFTVGTWLQLLQEQREEAAFSFAWGRLGCVVVFSCVVACQLMTEERSRRCLV